MSVKEDLDKKLAAARADATANAPPAKPEVPGELNLKNYPNAKAVERTRNGSIKVTY